MAGENIGPKIKTEQNLSEDAKRKEELKSQIQKRVASEERAFRIVESLVDVTVSFARLKDMVHFLLPTHYEDITEERAIVKICGFPVCKTALGKVRKQKYHISTKTNKVYDITEKQNFCSSKCFKQSKIFEKQILKSPLWTRDSEKPALFLLPDTETGWLGIEVISPEIFLDSDDTNKAEDDERTTKGSSILDSRNWMDELHETLCGEKPLISKEEKDQKSENLVGNTAAYPVDIAVTDPLVIATVDPSQIATVDPLEIPIDDENQGFDLRDVSDFLKDQMSDDDVSERLSTVFDSDDDLDSMVEATLPLTQKKKSSCLQIDELDERLSNVRISKDDENLERRKNSSETKVDYFKKLLNCRTKSLSGFIDSVPVGVCVEPPPSARDVTNEIDSTSSPVSATSLPMPKSTPSVSAESVNLASNQHQIQNKLSSWITQETLRYLGMVKDEECDTVEDSESASQNTDFAKLCDNLDLRGMDFDELLDGRLVQSESAPKRSLPSYDKLQKETAKFGLKVKEYYKAPQKKEENKMSDGTEFVYVVPHVDSVSQIPIRRSIVLQQLGKRMNELLNPMNIILGEISTEIKDLVSTCNLQNNNVSFKPAEWSIVCIFLIFMLSKKLKKLDVALQKTKVQDKFTEILKKFNLNLQEVQEILDNEILHL